MYSTRNAYYLRVSNYKVIPLFLYLDERHVNWMSDEVLDEVVEDLRPKMQDLLLVSRTIKKHRVHVERGEGYQYCYFLRNSSRTEVVLLKHHTLVQEDVKPDIDPDGNVKDYKPQVDVSYKGFGTSAHQLVVIVEPWPPLAPEQYAPPSSRLSSRSASVASSRSRTGSRVYGSRAVSVASVEPQSNPSSMRNASTPLPNSRQGGSTPLRESSATPGFGSGRVASRSATPLFLPSDTPFDQDEEDELAHQSYLDALRDGRVRLPSVSRPAGTELGKTERRSVKRQIELDEDEDEPEGMESLSGRLVRNSEMEERVVRVHGGWEERDADEVSAVMGPDEL